jgi:hypothetical protein
MLAAQELEGRLKLLFHLHDLIVTTSRDGAPLSDEAFEAMILEADKKTLGHSLKGIFAKLGDLGVTEFPDEGRLALWKTIGVRNFVTHHYLEKRGALLDDKAALPHLLSELAWFSELFHLWLPVLDKWSDLLIKAIGFSEDEIEAMRNRPDTVIEALRHDQLVSLCENLGVVGIKVSPPKPQMLPA